MHSTRNLSSLLFSKLSSDSSVLKSDSFAESFLPTFTPQGTTYVHYSIIRNPPTNIILSRTPAAPVWTSLLLQIMQQSCLCCYFHMQAILPRIFAERYTFYPKYPVSSGSDLLCLPSVATADPFRYGRTSSFTVEHLKKNWTAGRGTKICLPASFRWELWLG